MLPEELAQDLLDALGAPFALSHTFVLLGDCLGTLAVDLPGRPGDAGAREASRKAAIQYLLVGAFTRLAMLTCCYNRRAVSPGFVDLSSL